MRAPRSIGLGVLMIALGAASLAGLPAATSATGSGPPAAPPAETPESSLCFPDAAKEAHPDVILLGEEVGITLTVRVVCAGERIPVHIVLVLDVSL